MRKNTEQKILMIVCVACMATPPASMARAIPPDPDNAALLYYQALLTIPKLEGEAGDHLPYVAKGKVAPDDDVREFIEKCRNAIEFVEAAADVPMCHWGYRFSQGLDVQMTHLSQMRRLAFILAADARIGAFDGDYRRALERCLLMDSVSRHIGDDTIISYLVSIVVRQLGRQCMQEVIGRAAGDAELLRWLKNELVTSEPWAISPVRPLKIEVEIMTDLMQMDKRDRLPEVMAGPDGANTKETADFVATLDADTLEHARGIYRERIASMLTVMSTPMPYAESYSRLKQLSDDFDPNDPASRVAGAFMPAMSKIYTLKTRCEAHANAIEAGVDICLRRAESGKLPESLPAGLAKDPFSGEDFAYERTDSGFVLHCRGRDLSKDAVHEFAFLVK